MRSLTKSDEVLAAVQPIRSEIFSAARLEMHGESLARAQTVISNARKGKKITPTVAENRKMLERSYLILLDAVREKRLIAPAAEWVIDNFHIVLAQLKDIHDHLPPQFYSELPKLADGPLSGYPRVYGIAWAFVAHTDSRFDAELLTAFLKSYQRVQPLTIGELWAVSITLRLVLIENLRRLSSQIAIAQVARSEADRISDELLGLSESAPRNHVEVIAELESMPFVPALAVQFFQRLRYEEAKVGPVLQWLENRVLIWNLSADEVVSREHAAQAGANVTVRNIITSFRFMSAFDWQDFFEENSLAEQCFRENPMYDRMDFTTRDRYRHGLEELAKYSGVPELQIAQKIIAKTKNPDLNAPSSLQDANDPQQTEARRRDPGYYLISSGRKTMEKEIDFRAPLRILLLRFYLAFATPLFLGSLILFTLLTLYVPLHHAWLNGTNGIALVALFILGIFPASNIGLALVNRATISLLGPRHLPRLNLEDGIPENLRTFIVVPTMIHNISRIDEQLQQLEIHYLSNPKGDVFFAMLTDWYDSDQALSPHDLKVLDSVAPKLKRLNEKYPARQDGQLRFYVYHRQRKFNPSEGKWIGWERKRGKLHEFNRMLRGAKDTSYISIDGKEILVPTGVKYVITLDADTKLPNGAVNHLVGTIGHPLNHARFNRERNKVIGGYGILQPRITPMLATKKESTVYQRLSTGPAGMDPYASAVSDVYQDLFGEGSYTGKGIYDVDAFERALAGRVPENALLSHDLFEGNFARCGFLSDVEFFEEFPFHSGVSMARHHRWTRGDWQLLPWTLGFRGSGLSTIGRWKMIDNLRRSLVQPMSVLMLILAIAMPSSAIVGWLTLYVVGLNISSIVHLISTFLPPARTHSYTLHFKSLIQDSILSVERLLLSQTLIASQAYLEIDAIVRALYRLFISRKMLLEWTTAAQSKSAASFRLKSFIQSMQGGVICAVIGLIAIAVMHSEQLPIYLPFLVLWVLSPALARYYSLPPKEEKLIPLEPEDMQFLTLTGRKIWRFFSTFVTAADNFLPPDNFQEDPEPIVAHRSSPTNFGLYLLSVVAARDFGWIGTIEMTERLITSMKSMDRLERHHGHFLNWYDTARGEALEPKYISSVDNGNLAGHLLAIAQACSETILKPISPTAFNRGILQALLLLENTLAAFVDKNPDPVPEALEVTRIHQDLATRLLTPDQLITDRSRHWEMLRKTALELVSVANALAQTSRGIESTEIAAWALELSHDIESAERDFTQLFSWTEFEKNIENENPVHENAAAEQRSPRPWRHRLSKPLPRATGTSVRLTEIAEICESLLAECSNFEQSLNLTSQAELPPDFREFQLRLRTSVTASTKLIADLEATHALALRMFHEMDFSLLYEPAGKLFSIGYRVTDRQLDSSHYDLLASECRLTSLIAIAKGDVPASHWFRLGRPLTLVGNDVTLLSWSGSMFEYLMPSLVMYTPRGSLLNDTCRSSIKSQILYGNELGVPWGISESAYNMRDLHLTYQYQNFGLPDLGLKRGLGSDVVVAPYATLLASMYEPALAVENLRRLTAIGAEGPYGFYESVDYTPSRIPAGKSCVVIKAYMAHHQGMSLISIANIFKNGAMRDRFHAEPMIQAADLLLQERTPRNVGISKLIEEANQSGLVKEETEHVSRQYHDVNRPVPTTQLLANDEYSVMVTSSGSGYSRYRDIAINRWREDVTKDNWGTYIYLRDLESEKVWSATYQPTCIQAKRYEVTFADDRARFSREDDEISSNLEIFISPEDNAEMRRLTLCNRGTQVRVIEITSYFEVSIAGQNADVAHPAFSNLFVQTEYVSEFLALIATRRPRASGETPPWMAHVIVPDSSAIGEIEYETDRAKFIGRGKTVRNADAIYSAHVLTNTVGFVLDPVMSLRTRVRIEPGATSTLTYSTVIANSRDEVLRLADKFRDQAAIERATDLAWTQAQVKLHYLNIEPDEAHLFQRLGTRLLFSDSSLRPSSEIIKLNTKYVSGLWAYGISGDNPIILISINDLEDRGIVRQLLKAHDYLSSKRVVVDLVILSDKPVSYAQELHETLLSMVDGAPRSIGTSPVARGKIFVLKRDALPTEDRYLLYASARVILSSQQGSLAEQVRRVRPAVAVEHSASRSPSKMPLARGDQLVIPSLSFSNGIGGFAKDTSEYVIVLKPGVMTPTPWINVIAHSEFGFQVSESGAGYTWSLNSRENQMTPWSNDPVCDPPGEAFYIRDIENGATWSPTALPIRNPEGTYIARHGQGYSHFEHSANGIYSILTQFVAIDQPVKISTLKLVNHGTTARKLSITSYIEWVLGFSRASMAPTTITEVCTITGAVFAYNTRSDEYGTRISFATFCGGNKSFTCDRTEFIGRNGSLEQPAGVVHKSMLSGRAGAGLDPCAALQTEIELAAGASTEVVFIFGQAESRVHAQELILTFRTVDTSKALQAVHAKWDSILNKIQVETPDKAMDLMLNRWLLYQTMVCRFWARSAFYQAGGAYGFRDQLQDMLALCTSQPQIAREHILRAASRQFVEGDVQHWWHPPFGRGVRTHFSDDLLWLPYTVAHYVSVTHDRAILDSEITFLEGALLKPDQEDSYFVPATSHNTSSLFEHCARAIDKSLKTGAHGLPLMGCGDWNDGMNRVGKDGKGESVWLAWFLYTNLVDFSRIARLRGETLRADIWAEHAYKLQTSVETESWDGGWYRRAYFDDGTPLGSASGDECKIDSLAQTWAVISKAGDPERAKIAMQAVREILVQPQNDLIMLFTPPFDKTPLDPGYIKGYIPGVRENGGQYTHAAVWCVIAEAMMGNGERAHDLFRMLNPVNHGDTAEAIERYKVEPYVLAADVYSVAPHTGRGGWTWYTGSSGWMYRSGVEFILGIRLDGEELVIDPCIPPEWSDYKIQYRHGNSRYHIDVSNPAHVSRGVRSFVVDGAEQLGPCRFKLVDDGGARYVRIVMG